MSTQAHAVEALKLLEPFINPGQRAALEECMRGEEKQFFFDMLCDLAARVILLPPLYAQDGAGDQATVYLHYFIGGCDWHITELDPATGEAFGQADIGYGPELGYISIPELLENSVELDLYWEPKTLAEINQKRGA